MRPTAFSARVRRHKYLYRQTPVHYYTYTHMPTTHVDPKTLDESGSVGMNIMVTWLLHVFGILITPIYLSISCWRAHADYRNRLWAATLLLGTLIVTAMAFNNIKKHNTFGIFISALRSYVLPLYILSLTLYEEWTSTVCGLFMLVRVSLSICTYLTKPPPVKIGNDGKPQNLRIMLAGDSFFPKVDGVSTFSTQSIRYLQQNGHIVHVMTSKKGPSPLFGATVTRLPGIIPRSIDPHHSITLPIPWLLYPALFRFKPHVVHVFESIVPFSLGVMLACWLLDIPLVISHHTRIDMYAKWGTPWLPRWLMNILLFIFYRGIISFGDLNIGVCPSLIEWLRWTWTPGGLKPEMWQSGCEVDVFKPENATIETRRKLTQSRPDLPLIIYVGRMAQEKDSIELLPIFRRLHQRLNGKVRVALIGGGPMKKKLEMEAQDDTYILFPGFLRGEELCSACKNKMQRVVLSDFISCVYECIV